jgi:dihydrofolate synthase / folylpolyglutamate synthase
MIPEKKYIQALEWIHGLGRFGIRPGLGRVAALLEKLGNPHHRVRFVHVGGTNGKGSTAVMIASMLRAAGYRIGLYTSPYLLSFTNRMAVNGSDIDSGDLVELVDRIRPLVEEISSDDSLGEMTEFEVVTALALTYFAKKEVDLVVLEVGLGGRLDATNVITPLFSIITNISLEHTDVLGNTVEEIAFEKAGIIKQGKPLITAAEDQKVLAVLKSRCAELGSPFYSVYPLQEDSADAGNNRPSASLSEITEEGQFFSYRGFAMQFERLFVPLRGLYQLSNAATALAAVELLAEEGFPVTEDALRSGLAATVWPGRLELLSSRPLLIMDGAHNPAAIEKLSAALPAYFTYRRLVLVIGMLADKDTEAMLKYILPLADTVIFTRPLLPRAADPGTIAAFAVSQLNFKKDHEVIYDHGEALDRALDLAGPDDAVLVTGSLYTVSDIRAYWEKRSAEKEG